jgi:hypothetical protein
VPARRIALLVSLALIAGGAFLLLRARDPGAESGAEGGAEGELADAAVRAACSRCHAFPPPDILPRETWRGQIEHMAKLVDYLAEPPPQAIAVEQAVAWYEARAPERLPDQVRETRPEPGPLRFRRRGILLGEGSGPGVATVARVSASVAPELAPVIAAPNMANGSLHLFSLFRGPLRIGEAGHPARIASADLDGDGRDELVVSDLGDPMPSDEPLGRVLLARGDGSGGFELRTLLDGVGRVADAQPIDLDGDGDLDLVVASFGWLNRGGVHVLVNEDPARLAFRAVQVSDRAGPVSVVPVVDLFPGSGAGFAVAFAQHHETVSVFHPRGSGFEETLLYRAPHPNWGTSNLEATDLDGDGDTDFLLAHGDTLDDGIAFKPWHGVEWLENTGSAPFTAHRIGALYGAHRAEAADLDGDGDLDVVACAFLPQVQLPVPPEAIPVDSVVWYERDGDTWTPWSIEANHPRHTGCAVVDLDGDGRLDVVGAVNTAWDVKVLESGASLEVFFNVGGGR